MFPGVAVAGKAFIGWLIVERAVVGAGGVARHPASGTTAVAFSYSKQSVKLPRLLRYPLRLVV